jgi:IS30 family transposase
MTLVVTTEEAQLTTHMTVAQKQLARRLRAKGFTLDEIARQLGPYSHVAVIKVLRGQHRPGMPERWRPGPGRLSIAEREEILLGLTRGESFAAIARALGRSTSTVSREVNANGGRTRYRMWPAHDRAQRLARRPKPCKLDHKRLQRVVVRWLEDFYSPDQISGRLRIEFPDDPMMQVSHETIYKTLYVQGKGELKRELTRCLRTGRAKRVPKGTPKKGYIPNMVNISERPAEARDRAVPGHWEGDLIMGKDNKTAVGTLVERTTRFTLLLHLGDDRSAENVERQMRREIERLPEELRRSITWDQGKEMVRHVEFTVATGIPVFFCDPYKAWQRGTNENTNRLLRQYLPKYTDLSKYSRRELKRIQDSLNRRPRKTLGYLSPSERLTEVVATAA